MQTLSYLAVIAWTKDFRIARYAEFRTKADALKHAKDVASRYPNVFVVATPDAFFSHWLIDPAKRMISIVPPADHPAKSIIPAADMRT